MRSPRFTDIGIGKLKPGLQRREIRDPDARGLYLIIQTSGQRGFAVRYRFEGVPCKLTLPAGISLAGARKLAAAALAEVAEGRNPAEAKQAAKRAAHEARQQARAAAELQHHDGVAALAVKFIEKYAKRETRASSWTRSKSLFDRIVLPAWRGRTVHEIRRRDVIDLVEAVAEGDKHTRPRPVLANRVLAVLSKFFNWLMSQDVIVASPARGVVRPTKEVERERTLTDDELKQLWQACGEISPHYGAAIRVLVLTAQRRNEVAWLPWAEINKDTRLWTLPAARAKNDKAHTIPLATQVWDILSSVPLGGDPAFVFGHQLADFGRIKRQLDAKLAFAERWTIHDLRRTAASGLQKTGAPIHVIEQILNHRSGAFKGIVAVYQKHVYDAEKATALQKWADYVERLVSGQADANVLPMQKVAASGERA